MTGKMTGKTVYVRQLVKSRVLCKSLYCKVEGMVLPERIELSTSPLPKLL